MIEKVGEHISNSVNISVTSDSVNFMTPSSLTNDISKSI